MSPLAKRPPPPLAPDESQPGCDEPERGVPCPVGPEAGDPEAGDPEAGDPDASPVCEASVVSSCGPDCRGTPHSNVPWVART